MKLLWCALFPRVCFSVLACKRADPPSHARVIGVSLLTRGQIFYRDLEDGLRSQAAQHDFELLVTSADFDLGKQIAQIEDFIARKVDAIIVCPVDSKGIGNGIKEANRAAIPVFTADIAAQEEEVVSHIASDDFAGGRLAGEYLGGALGGHGDVVSLEGGGRLSALSSVRC